MHKLFKSIINGLPAMKRTSRVHRDAFADYERKSGDDSMVAVLRDLLTPKVLLAYSGLFLIGFGAVSVALQGII